MPCFYPLVAYRDVTNKDYSRRGRIIFHPSFPLQKPFNIPCGQCVDCKLNYAREWAIRCEAESLMQKKQKHGCCFITLTYTPAALADKEEQWNLDHRDFQLFMKRLRKTVKNKIRYYMCGEYGELNQRPHFHALIFGHDFRQPDNTTKWCNKCNKFHTINKVLEYKGKYPLFTSTQLQRLWPHGLHRVGELNFETSSYTARYMMKKLKTNMVSDYSFNTPGIDQTILNSYELNKEYCSMSRGNRLNPENGIGLTFYKQYKDSIYAYDSYVSRDKKHESKPPKYWDRLLKIDDPKLYEEIKKARIEKMENEPLVDRNDPRRKRLKQREDYKIKMLDYAIKKL